jgi:uncharacterized protein YbjT (DUF2867 family)
MILVTGGTGLIGSGVVRLLSLASVPIAAYQRAGGPTETITSVVADLTGKPPRTFAEFARDYAGAFLRH